jgi:hypothetical protein
MKQYLDFDPFTGIAHWVDTDETTGITTYGVDQEADAIIEANKDAYNADHVPWGDGQPVARIPMALYAEWVREGKDKDQVFLKRFLNDPENRHFRLRPGVI